MEGIQRDARIVSAPGVYYPLFDWLRFALASGVVISHAGLFPDWLHIGNIFVQVFFALSGWLIGGILLRTQAGGLPRFFFNRATRIWIPYAFAVAALYAVAFLKDGGFDPRYLVADLTFTHNWFLEKTPEAIAAMPLSGTGSHFWSIAVEEQFYLAAPLLIVLTPFGRNVWVWAGIAAWALATQGWYGSISFGVLAALVQYRVGDWHLEARPLLWIMLALSTVALGEFYYLAVPFFSISIVLLCASPGRRWAIPAFLGGTSYPLYLNHWLGLFAGNALLGHTTAGAVAGAVIGFGVGAVAYLVVDRNVMAYRGRFFSRRIGMACAATAYAIMIVGVGYGIST